MGLVEIWNRLAKKKLYINSSWEIPMGRIMYFVILNLFITLGMWVSGGNAAGMAWLWADMVASFQHKGEKE